MLGRSVSFSCGWRYFGLSSRGAALAGGFVLTLSPLQAQDKGAGHASSLAAVGFAESGAVRDLPKVSSTLTKGKMEEEINPENREIIRHVDPKIAPSRDKALFSTTAQAGRSRTVQPQALPTPAVSFDGISQADTIAADSNQGFLPPDTNGAVGPNHFVQTVNSCFRVWNKAGSPVTATTSLGTLFSPLGCGTSIDGDPIVLYDQLADRWIISEFCTVASPNDHQLVAVSKTSDPSGAYFLYDFMMPNNKFNDYPHLSVWPDGYYMTDNQFNQAGNTFQQAGVFAFDRAKMLAGDATAGFVYFDTALLFPPGTGNNGSDGIGGMLPANADGLIPPAVGAPCPFAYVQAGEFGDPADQLRLFDFHADFTAPVNSTFTERPGSPLPVAAFDPVTVPNSRNVVPQPAPAVAGSYLDAINDRLMFRLAYRNFGTSESLVLNHTVNAASNPAYRAGVRFYQLSRSTPAAAFTIAEQQTFAGVAGDTTSRWMGSVAMNFQGDIALGYSVSSTSVSPSIRYAARLNTDPPGSGLAQGEQILIAGAGSQTSTSGRWGDYSDMTVDPSDDCAFWYTQEYYAANSGSSWRTRIARIVVGTSAVSPRGTISGTVTDCSTGLPVANAIVKITGGFWRSTAANGTYSATVAPGTYTATASSSIYAPATSSNLVVTNGGTASFNVCLNGFPTLVAAASAITADSCNSNGAIDPNETVTVSLGLKNTGSANTTNLVATLQSSGGVTLPSGPQPYGVAAAGGAPVFKSFIFTAGTVACGSSVVASLTLQDGASNLGTITYNFATGAATVALSEKFDSVVVPALPAGWTAANVTGAAPLWVTTSSTSDTAPNNAFIDEPDTVSDKHLDSPGFAVTSNGSQVTFRNNYNVESGFDGCVLEVSSPNINGGTFTDVTDPAVGGSFVSGGYNGTISTAFNSPISGRQAWTGSSGGYITTVVNLGANVTGHTVGLRFRMASDEGTTGAGWHIDTLTASGGFVCCGVTIAPAPPAVLTAENFVPANAAPDPGEFVTVSLPLQNTAGSNTSNLIGTLQASGGVTNPGAPQNYGIVTGGGAPVARSFSFIASGSCGGNLTLSLALQDGASNLGTITYTLRLGAVTSSTQTFSNASAITIPASGTGASTGAPAAPYPSNVVVSGLTNPITQVTVTLKNITHTFPGDVDVLLVAPTGQKFILMSDVLGTSDWTGQSYSLDDSAAALLPASGAAPASGSFRPTNYGTGDVFPAPAPAGPYLTPATAGGDTLTSAFAGLSPNGTWSLYVVDDGPVDVGSFAGGWDLKITTAASVCIANQPPLIVTLPPPSPVIVGTPYSFTFLASGNPTPSFSLSGLLPPGLGLSATGTLSGTATSGGNGTFPNITVAASNGVLPNAAQTFTLTTATRAGNYLASFGLTGSNGVFTFDYDSDGLANLLEYALGLNPAVASLNGLPVVTLKDYSGTSYLSMTFNRSSLVTDLSYIVQGSSDLTNWTDLGTSTAGNTTSGPGFVAETGSAPTLSVEVRDTVPYDPNTMMTRFLRLKVTSP